ncbi:MAG: tetratricopeptide repeat protein [Myxococcales bacterium]|nr:tetratricopeptide repeat protein [Myxococcales bacterium]
MPRPSDALFRDLAESQSRAVADPAALERLRAAVMRAELPQRRWAKRGLWAAGVVALAWVVWGRFGPEPRFHVAGSAGRVGMVLTAAHTSVPVRFAEGSSVVLTPGTRGHVIALGEAGAALAIERGSFDVSVVHAKRTRWQFLAGPFTVLVTGTKFRATWEPGAGTLEIEMREGSVRVSGGPLGRPVAVRDQQIFRVAASGRGPATGELSDVARRPAAPLPALPPAVAPEGASAESPALAPRPFSPPSRAARVRGSPAWVAYAHRGEYARAFATAQGLGLEGLAGSLGPADLLLLADTARFARQPSTAARVFEHLVSRFPDAPEAADARFGLGRLAFQLGKWQEASRWFGELVDVGGEGALTQAAWARLFESLDRVGDGPAARARAREYMHRFPVGPHREAALRFAGNEPP